MLELAFFVALIGYDFVKTAAACVAAAAAVLLQTVGSGTLEKTPEAWQMKFFTRVDAEANSPQEERRNVKQKLQRWAFVSFLLECRPIYSCFVQRFRV